jgi:hypothetical protein
VLHDCICELIAVRRSVSNATVQLCSVLCDDRPATRLYKCARAVMRTARQSRWPSSRLC